MIFYSLALELTALTAVWLCLGVWQKHRNSPGSLSFVLLGLSAATWCMGDGIDLRGIDELAAHRIRYAGVLTLPPLWLGLAAHATGLPLARRVPWFAAVLLVPGAICYALLFAGDWSALFLQTVPGGEDHHGPLWWLQLVYAYGLILGGSLLFGVSALRSSSQPTSLRRAAVGIAALFPLAGNAVWVDAGMSWPADPTPALFGVALVALHSAIFRGELLQALPVSQRDLLEQLPVGVVLTDRRGVVIDLNPAAERRLGIAEARAVGRNLDAVLAEAPCDLTAEVAPVFSGTREVGQMALLDPPDKLD